MYWYYNIYIFLFQLVQKRKEKLLEISKHFNESENNQARNS